jgi:hypothetical protein
VIRRFAAIALISIATPAPALAEAIGVIIVPIQEQELPLADNLTEVAMARIAETPGRTLAGTFELRRRLGAEAGRDVTACLAQPTCLGRVGVSLGVSRLITGEVRAEKGRFFLSLVLTDIVASRVQARFFRQIDGQIADLMRAVQDGVDELLNARRVAGRLRVHSRPAGARVTLDDSYLGTTPLISEPLPPGAHQLRVQMERRLEWRSIVKLSPGQDLDLDLGERELPRRRTWAPYAAYGSAGAAALGASAGAVFGIVATTPPPSGQTREEAQMDLGRRRTYGRVGTTLLVSSAVMALVSAAIFYRNWRDLFAD